MSLFNKFKTNTTADESETQDELFVQNLQTNSHQTAAEQSPTEQTDDDWLDEEYEGQLSVDVYQENDHIIIKSTIAGVDPKDLDVTINNDMVTIKGKREANHTINDEDYFYQECYWGGFSRSIILPAEVVADDAAAELKNGVLTIRLPKAKKSKAVSVKING